MDRIAIKENAKKMIKGNLWYIWKPVVYLMLVAFAFGFVFGMIDVLAKTDVFVSIGSSLISVFASIFEVGYAYYCLGFVRGQRMEVKDVWEFIKKVWVVALLASILMGLNVALGLILLIIPGIIAALGLSLYAFVIADNPELTTTDALRKTWEITKGHKVEIFVFILSFIGWEILGCLTLGILYIWLAPYMTIASTLVYESLKK